MRVDQTRLRPDPTSTSTHGAEAAQPLLRLFRPHRKHKSLSDRLTSGAQGCFGFIAMRSFPSGVSDSAAVKKAMVVGWRWARWPRGALPFMEGAYPALQMRTNGVIFEGGHLWGPWVPAEANMRENERRTFYAIRKSDR